MSEPSSLNTPLMPVCDAMPASLAFMLSNSGPSVSVRRYRARRRYIAACHRVDHQQLAAGLASTFWRVLLKNWNDSAMCLASTYCTCDR